MNRKNLIAFTLAIMMICETLFPTVSAITISPKDTNVNETHSGIILDGKVEEKESTSSAKDDNVVKKELEKIRQDALKEKETKVETKDKVQEELDKLKEDVLKEKNKDNTVGGEVIISNQNQQMKKIPIKSLRIIMSTMEH